MAKPTRSHDQYAEYIIDSIAKINPYNRSGENSKSEYYIYQMGFLASYLASTLEHAPYKFKQFKQHVDAVNRSR